MNHSLIFSWKFDRPHVNSFWKLQFRGFFSLQLMATYFESQPVFHESLTDLVSIYFEGFDFVATFHCDSFYWCLRDIVILINALVHSLFWSGLADLRSKRQWEYQRGLSLGEWSMCPFLHFKQHWSSAVISPASVVSADLFRLQSSFSYCFFRRRKPSIWAIVFAV